MSVNAVQNQCQSFQTQFQTYVNTLPEGTAGNALKSFGYGTAIGMLCTGNPVLGLAHGVATAVASLTYTVSAPIFQKIAEGHAPNAKNVMTNGEHTLRIFVSALASAYTISMFTRIDVISNAMISTVISVLFSPQHNVYPINQSVVIY